jgi:fatty acid desaturase
MNATSHLTRAEVRELSRLSAWRGLGSIAWTWMWIAGALALYCVHPSIITFAVGWVIVTGRHLALAILMHEGAHFLLLRNKRYNDIIGSWLTAYPIMLSLHAYRNVPLQHHKATWTDADPDLGLATPFPITRRSMLRKVMRDLFGITGWQRYRLIARLSAGVPPRGKGLCGVPLRKALATFFSIQKGFILTNALLLAALAAAGHPEAFFLLWWLPALTGYSLVLRLRSIAEHAVVSDPTDELRQTRTTHAPFWLRFFIAPHNVNLHLEHHLFMFVPHYNLPKAHRMLRAAGVLARAEVAKSYWEVLRKATSSTSEQGPKTRGTLLPSGG